MRMARDSVNIGECPHDVSLVHFFSTAGLGRPRRFNKCTCWNSTQTQTSYFNMYLTDDRRDGAARRDAHRHAIHNSHAQKGALAPEAHPPDSLRHGISSQARYTRWLPACTCKRIPRGGVSYATAARALAHGSVIQKEIDHAFTDICHAGARPAWHILGGDGITGRPYDCNPTQGYLMKSSSVPFRICFSLYWKNCTLMTREELEVHLHAERKKILINILTSDNEYYPQNLENLWQHSLPIPLPKSLSNIWGFTHT